MKNILLKLANWTYNHYNNSIEINFKDIVKFNGIYFRIICATHTKEIGCIDTLTLELHDVEEGLRYRLK